MGFVCSFMVSLGNLAPNVLLCFLLFLASILKVSSCFQMASGAPVITFIFQAVGIRKWPHSLPHLIPLNPNSFALHIIKQSLVTKT